MQQFLGQLERMGQGLVGHRDEAGLYLWIVAGAAVVMACEIARRQVRRARGRAGRGRRPRCLVLSRITSSRGRS